MYPGIRIPWKDLFDVSRSKDPVYCGRICLMYPGIRILWKDLFDVSRSKDPMKGSV